MVNYLILDLYPNIIIFNHNGKRYKIYTFSNDFHCIDEMEVENTELSNELNNAFLFTSTVYAFFDGDKLPNIKKTDIHFADFKEAKQEIMDMYGIDYTEWVLDTVPTNLQKPINSSKNL